MSVTDEEFIKYGPRGKRTGQGRLPVDPHDAYEIVKYTFEDGTSSIRRYYRGTMRIRESYRDWIGSGELWPDEFVDWWMHFCEGQAKNVGYQNNKKVVDYELVTGEYLDEETAGGGTDSGD